MSWFANEARVAVDLGECRCPGTPHDGGDTVWLRQELGVDGGFAIIGIIATPDDTPLIERLGRAYLRHGIVDWTLCDSGGAKVPCTPENIDRLAWSGPLLAIANKASDLYGEAVLGPLAQTASESSPSGQSDASTSQTPASSD